MAVSILSESFAVSDAPSQRAKRQSAILRHAVGQHFTIGCPTGLVDTPKTSRSIIAPHALSVDDVAALPGVIWKRRADCALVSAFRINRLVMLLQYVRDFSRPK